MPQEGPPERRDLQGLIADMRVDVASIKTRVEVQTGALARLEQKLDLGVFREEYERRQKELEAEVKTSMAATELVRDDYLRRQGGQVVWRWIYGVAIASLGLVEVWFHR